MDDTRQSGESPYQLVFLHGLNADAATQIESRVVEVALTSPDYQEALSSLQNSALAPADTKTTALYMTSGPADVSVTMYAALVGYSGRYIDVAVYPSIDRIAPLVATGRKIARSAEASVSEETPIRFDRVVIAPFEDSEYETVIYDVEDPLSSLDLTAATKIRFARRVAIVLPDSVSTSFRLFAAIAGMRSTKNRPDRMPDILLADRTLVELETLRKDARALRHQLQLPTSEQLVARVEPDLINELLTQARVHPVEPVLRALGSVQGEDPDYWRCPRPERHLNGDKNPSTRVTDGKVRCFVCDAEWVDPVALVMSIAKISPSEAAAFVLSTS